jgi:hypothetical protein
MILNVIPYLLYQYVIKKYVDISICLKNLQMKIPNNHHHIWMLTACISLNIINIHYFIHYPSKTFYCIRILPYFVFQDFLIFHWFGCNNLYQRLRREVIRIHLIYFEMDVRQSCLYLLF